MAVILSVIIPCYNDYQHLSKIVAEISKLPFSHEIIVVNDGSNSQTKSVLNLLSGITLINHSRNLGKSQALKTGYLAAKGKYLVFFDSDYLNVKVEYFRLLIDPVISGKYDIAIGQSDEGFPFFNWIGLTTMLSGLRCFPRNILPKNCKIFNNHGYIKGFLFEARFNCLIFSKYRIAKVRLFGLKQQYKIQKTRSLGSFYNDIRILYQIYHYLGPKQYFTQLKFCRRLKTI